MTESDRPDLTALDRLCSDVRADVPDDAATDAIVERALSSAGGRRPSPSAVLAGCDDVRRLLPELVEGRLAPAQELLVRDHTRGCVGCRRALTEARGDTRSTVPPADLRRTSPLPRILAVAAALLLVVGGALIGARLLGDAAAERNLVATIHAIDGELRHLEAGSDHALAVGDTVHARDTLRTTAGSTAVLRLGDGSEVEVAPRTRLALRATVRGTNIVLDHGNIIVRAAEQHSGRLRVDTPDCTVAVRGTIFAVDHGLKGSRVSVIDGRVEVRRAAGRELLSPGDQLTTGNRLHELPIADQIAWSTSAPELLEQLARLHSDLTKAIDPAGVRTASELLDLAPADTVVYLAVPNLARGLEGARRILDERLAASEVLRSWWQDNVVGAGIDREIDDLLDRLQQFGGTVGDKLVVAVPKSAVHVGGGPLALARLADPAAFERLLAELAASAPADAVELIDDLGAPAPAGAEVLLWIHDDLVAAASDLELLRQLALRLDDPAGPGFASRPLHARLADAYRGGVSWLVGVDLEAVVADVAAHCSTDEKAMLDRLGLLDATTFVAERHRDGDSSSLAAELAFSGPRRGAAAWLAAPAPMESLGFVSPQASFAVAAIAKDAAVIFDELISAVAVVEPTVTDELDELRRASGVDIRADLAAALGGEAVFAVDGPLLPTPAWKLVAEVVDPVTLEATIERAVAELVRVVSASGETPPVLDAVTVAGRTARLLRQPGADLGLAWLITDGYLIAAPDPALIEHALSHRASGVNLPAAQAFRELLPTDAFTDCSALVYRNLDQVAGALPQDVLAGVPPSLIEDLAEPGLICAYGLEDRIVVAGTGGDALQALHALSIGRLLAAPDGAARTGKAVSSPG